MSENERLLDPEALERLEAWGGQELVSRMVELFLEVTPQRMDEIRTGLAEDDLTRVERGAHSLRSSAGNLGAVPVRQLASRIEELSAIGRSAELERAVEELEERFDETLEALRGRAVEGSGA